MDTKTADAGRRTKVISSVLFRIDPASNTVDSSGLNAALPDLEDYLAALLSEIGEQSQKRSFRFESPKTEFRSCLGSFVSTKNLRTDPHAELLAARLLRQEVETRQRYKNLNEVTRGSFLQFIYEEAGQISYLGVKVEHQSFLDEKDFVRKFGLADERRLYKACRVNFDAKAEPAAVWVFDTNGKPAAYWWREFLELQVLRDDTENTKNAAQAVMNVLGGLKAKHPADHTLLRNAALAAFKQQSEMNYGRFVTDIFEKYEPTDPLAQPAIGKLVERLKELPDKRDFDTQFTLVPSAVPFRQRKYHLSPEISLSVNDGIANLSDKVWREQTEDGRDLVVIRSDEAKNFILKKRT